eukprot:8264718-Alexandrium_andersonii.AAC.1
MIEELEKSDTPPAISDFLPMMRDPHSIRTALPHSSCCIHKDCVRGCGSCEYTRAEFHLAGTPC